MAGSKMGSQRIVGARRSKNGSLVEEICIENNIKL